MLCISTINSLLHMVLNQCQIKNHGTLSWASQKPWYLISALTKTMVHNHGYYGTKSGLIWVLISPSGVLVWYLLSGILIVNGTLSWVWQKQWYLISALTKTMVHNHGYYGTKSGLIWVLISASMVLVQWYINYQWYTFMGLTKTMVVNQCPDKTNGT